MTKSPRIFNQETNGVRDCHGVAGFYSRACPMHLHRAPRLLFALAWTTMCAAQVFAAGEPPTPPHPQDQGYAYTRTGRWSGVFKISSQVAVFAGSRYGFVQGYRVRLDDQDLLHGYAIRRDENYTQIPGQPLNPNLLKDQIDFPGGEIYVPASFAGYLTLKQAQPDAPAPDYFKDRWVYTIPRPAFTIPPGVRTLQVDGKTYVDFADAGRALGLHVFQDSSGLVCIGHRQDYDYTTHEVSLHDATVTGFDMPEKFADPSLAARSITRFIQAGITPATPPADIAPSIPTSTYNLAGFDPALLGSAVPSPGVYPRLLFSPDDLPAIRARLQANPSTRQALANLGANFAKTWWDPSTDQSQLFQFLSTGAPDSFKPDAFLSGDSGRATRVALANLAFYCLLAADDAHGRQVATAIARYYELLEPRLDEILAASESELGALPGLADFGETQWRGLDDLVSGTNLALAFDFSGRWMTDAQKETLRRIITKATYGRRINGRDDPRQPGQDATWGLGHLLAVAAIEGQQRFDPEAYAADAQVAQDFLDHGLDDNGHLAESGLTNTGLQNQILAMVILARRGENLWGHPHWRSFFTATASISAAKPVVEPDAAAILEFSSFFSADPTLSAQLARAHPNLSPPAFDTTSNPAQLLYESASR
jgi:hypothetical protein